MTHHVNFCPIFKSIQITIITEYYLGGHLDDLLHICDALRDLVPFVQFKKREKYPWRSITFSKVVGFTFNFTKSYASPLVFFTFFKLYKWCQIAERTTCKICFPQIITKSRNSKTIETIKINKTLEKFCCDLTVSIQTQIFPLKQIKNSKNHIIFLFRYSFFKRAFIIIFRELNHSLFLNHL